MGYISVVWKVDCGFAPIFILIFAVGNVNGLIHIEKGKLAETFICGNVDLILPVTRLK